MDVVNCLLLSPPLAGGTDAMIFLLLAYDRYLTQFCQGRCAPSSLAIARSVTFSIGGGGGNSLRPYSQQRPMRTNLSCCLGLIYNGLYKSTNGLLGLVPHGIMRILETMCMLLSKALKMRAIRDTMALVADSIGGTKWGDEQWVICLMSIKWNSRPLLSASPCLPIGCINLHFHIHSLAMVLQLQSNEL